MTERLKEFLNEMKSVFLAEKKNVFSDQGALVFFFIAILSYSIIYPVPLWHQLVREVPLAVVDLDNTSLSRQLVRFIDATENVRIGKRFHSMDEARRSFESGETHGIVYIPREFERKVLRSEKSHLSLFTSADYFMIYKQVVTGVSQAAGTLSAGIEVRKLSSAGIPQSSIMAVRYPVPLESVPLYNRSGAYGRYLIPMVMVMVLQQTMLIGIGLLGGTARERRNIHYLVSKNDSSYGTASVIAGRTALYGLIYMAHVIFYFEVLFRLFGYPRCASIFLVMLFFLPFILSVSFLGMTLSTVFRSRESSLMFLLCTAIPFSMLSGFSWPPESIPHWLRALSMLVPSTAGVDGLMRLELMGAPFSAVLARWGTLWLLTVLYFFCAVLSFRRIRRLHDRNILFS
jgi:ABC-2 type transport system permease protein